MSLFLILLINCSEDKISLTGTGTLTGKVVAVEDFLPLENVKISTNPTSSTVFTNALGEFEIQDLIVNDYSVQAEKDGYLTQFEGISITDNSVVNLIFEMDVETANNKPPVAPVLDSPADNATDLETEVQLIWSGSDPDGDEINYSIEILNDLNSEILEFSNISDTTYTVSGLKYGTKYFWQVSATDEI
ncbi:MAG: carboxypeptidase regulatory-like domain-containing protein, partial [Bacteroidia bacterium]|nr:carboxypeptidase regulatory-like domain-containing protein [Bacteroidia bacterium]